MSALRELAGRLDAFLAHRRTTRDILVSTFDGLVGSPLLIVATGSVLQGFDNPLSDLDLSVVVDQDITRISNTTRGSDMDVDATYFGASAVESWAASLSSTHWPPVGRLTRNQHDRVEVAIRYGTRFRDSVTLSARDGWDRWVADFREPWMAVRVVQWWRIESVRRWVAARWLVDAKPLLAAQRYYEAVLAALESRAAAGGQLYLGPKWLAEKLRILDDCEGLDVLRAIIRMPTTATEALRYSTSCDALLDRLSGNRSAAGLVAQLWYGSGVQVREVDGSMLVSRWNLRGLELHGPIPPMTNPATPIWEGDVGVQPPASILALFVEDMTWLSIVANAA